MSNGANPNGAGKIIGSVFPAPHPRHSWETQASIPGSVAPEMQVWQCHSKQSDHTGRRSAGYGDEGKQSRQLLEPTEQEGTNHLGETAPEGAGTEKKTKGHVLSWKWLRPAAI